MTDSLLNLSNEFLGVVVDTYFFYLDGFKGLELMHADLEQKQRASQSNDSDLVPYIKCHNEPYEEHGLLVSTVGQVKKRNAEGGRNYELLGNLCLVAIYSWWEDRYRKEFATCLRKEKNEIKSSVMSDIRILRHAIIHNNGIATEDCEKCELLKWFKRGDRIFIMFEQFEDIFSEIQKFLMAFYKQSLLIG